MTKVAFLWHMHQPYYEDLATGEHILPWVRLHALKDYYGMVALLREFPKVRMTFNLVPSLLVQLQAFAEGRARDRVLELGLKPASELSDEDRAFIIANFFHAQRTRMIDRCPRYAELLEQRETARRSGVTGNSNVRSQIRAFDEADLRDLQVWQKLVWIDPYYHDEDARIRALVEKGRGFSEDDKLTLRSVELELLRRIIPEYRAAADRRQVELSVSPFYHPILPLLCDTDVYLRNDPQAKLPPRRFQRPEDAREQLSRATTFHEQCFGRRPRGLWPSEGSVSDAVVPLAVEAGFRWMATDEIILSRSIGQPLQRVGHDRLEQPEVLYRPYRVGVGQTGVTCLFRDHMLSDLIGFSYAHWPAQDAARDFVDRLAEAGRRYGERTGGGEATISIILDGENAWEHYEGGGRPFLRALYQRLSDHAELRTVTMEEAASGPSEPLRTLYPGSWVNGDFYIWIGHADDRKAWGQLAEAREAYAQTDPGFDRIARAQAYEEILIAEGSDWCWWYGDDHSSGQDFEFDDLFRRHLRNVFRLLQRPVPEELYLSNISSPLATGDVLQPAGFLNPSIDGRPSSYFEWLGAGVVNDDHIAGAMHQVSDAGVRAIRALHFGFDSERLYIRLDLDGQAADILAPARIECRLIFLAPAGVRITVRLESDGWRTVVSVASRPGEWTPREAPHVRVAVDEILELAIPLETLNLKSADPVAFSVVILEDGVERERYPRYRPVETQVPGRQFEAQNWRA
jgi:alpha-amylase/alpha-mannosidase (GH57 family)